ncbi:MAG: hypothetical protein R3E79_02735 [Caldilineaceae bacterium]
MPTLYSPLSPPAPTACHRPLTGIFMPTSGWLDITETWQPGHRPLTRIFLCRPATATPSATPTASHRPLTGIFLCRQ